MSNQRFHIRRKFSLEAVGKRFENVEIEASGTSLADVMLAVDNAFKQYIIAIQRNLIQ